jgi:hypothetical protein
MIDKKLLCKFLVQAKKATYAAGDSAPKAIEADKSTTLIFESGDWKYHDNYFGGEPFGGREVIFWENKPVYIMTYYGQVNKSIADFRTIYKFLQKALNLIPEDKPFRGPAEFSEGDLLYLNNSTGEVDNFFGEELIKQNGQEIYKTKYLGGLIDQR